MKSNKDMSMLTVHKYHVCMACWPVLIKTLDSLDEFNKPKQKA